MPDLQTVYRGADGQILMYVRTEKRKDRSEHLFAVTREGTIFQRWLEDVPEDMELIIDTEGRKQANDTKWLLHVAEHEREILAELLRRACSWLPDVRARELREAFKASRP